MGRSPCCDEVALKKGPWTPEEDKKLVEHIQRHGHGSWRSLPKKAGLNRCGKSCRLRWTNYLRPDIKRGKFSVEEEQMIIQLHSLLGNKWSTISRGLPGRTDNEIKNYWNTHLKKKLLLMGIDPVTHRRRADLDLIANLPGILAAATANYQNLIGNLGMPLNNALRLQAEAVNLVLQTLIQSMAAASTATTTSPTNPNGDYIVAAAASPSGPAPMLQDLATNPCTSESIKLEINSSNGGAPRAHSGEQAAAAAAAMAAYMANSPASISLDVGLHGLDLGESDDSMICWKEIIDQICWSSELS